MMRTGEEVACHAPCMVLAGGQTDTSSPTSQLSRQPRRAQVLVWFARSQSRRRFTACQCPPRIERSDGTSPRYDGLRKRRKAARGGPVRPPQTSRRPSLAGVKRLALSEPQVPNPEERPTEHPALARQVGVGGALCARCRHALLRNSHQVRAGAHATRRATSAAAFSLARPTATRAEVVHPPSKRSKLFRRRRWRRCSQSGEHTGPANSRHGSVGCKFGYI